MVAFAMASFAAGVSVAEADVVRVYAAGSLRQVMTEMVQAFASPAGTTVTTVFGPSGILREWIEKGEDAHVFASADLSNAQALARTGRAPAHCLSLIHI